MTARLTRSLAAVLLLAGGMVHYDLWRNGYRHIPTIGLLFMANFVGSIALAVAVTVSRRVTVAFAGIAFAAGSLAALLLSRTVGVFGFTETIWTTQAVRTLLSEVGAILTLAVAATMQIRSANHFPRQPVMVPIATTGSHRRGPRTPGARTA
jgi:hypothetical protein